MRRALDVGAHEGRGRPDQAHGPRPMRQFAQDGDVPVVRLQGRKDPGVQAASARLEEVLQSERAAREHADAALKHANATIQALQTKIAHAELSHQEALAAQARGFESRLAEQEAARPEPTPELEPRREPRPEPRSEPRRAKQPAASVEDAGGEAEPVEWWVPGWREGLGRSR